MGNSVCVDGKLRENHRRKLWLVWASSVHADDLDGG